MPAPLLSAFGGPSDNGSVVLAASRYREGEIDPTIALSSAIVLLFLCFLLPTLALRRFRRERGLLPPPLSLRQLRRAVSFQHAGQPLTDLSTLLEEETLLLQEAVGEGVEIVLKEGRRRYFVAADEELLRTCLAAWVCAFAEEMHGRGSIQLLLEIQVRKKQRQARLAISGEFETSSHRKDPSQHPQFRDALLLSRQLGAEPTFCFEPPIGLAATLCWDLLHVSDPLEDELEQSDEVPFSRERRKGSEKSA